MEVYQYYFLFADSVRWYDIQENVSHYREFMFINIYALYTFTSWLVWVALHQNVFST